MKETTGGDKERDNRRGRGGVGKDMGGKGKSESRRGELVLEGGGRGEDEIRKPARARA